MPSIYPVQYGTTNIGSLGFPFQTGYIQALQPATSGTGYVGTLNYPYSSGNFNNLQSINLVPQNSGVGDIGSTNKPYNSGHFNNIISPVTPYAWVSFNGNGGVTLNSSYNISGLRRPGVGNYAITFIRPMQDTNYMPMVTCAGGLLPNSAQPVDSGSYRFTTTNTSQTNTDSNSVSVIFYQNLTGSN